jgi:hypothetical protein
MPEIEFTGSEGQAFTLIPKGTYRCRVTDIVSEVNKNTQNRQLVLSAVIDHPDNQYDGRKFKDWFVLTAKAGWKLDQLLQAAIPGQYDKVPTDDVDDNGKPTFVYRFDTDDLIDATFRASVTIEEDNTGKERNRYLYMPEESAAEGARGKAKASERVAEAEDEDEDTEEAAEEKPKAKAAAKKSSRRERRAG